MDTAKRRFVCIIRSAPWITFETEADAEEMKKILAGFGAYTKEKLGNVLVSNKGIDFVSIYRSRAQNMCMRI